MGNQVLHKGQGVKDLQDEVTGFAKWCMGDGETY